ncbi:MAG: type II toxin-antitoxin system RelE/ParE family toxin [Rhodospirillaceae bacterium]|nr:type II toxin-antitoxin system RelE/ParE family toxin [Rhodospirillaceae bacterium]
MRVFKTKAFARFARAESIDDSQLLQAITEISQGLIDADLGGGVIKKRLARPGMGKSGGARSIVAYRSSGLAVFVFGYAKNARDDISPPELKAYRALARELLQIAPAPLAAAIRNGTLLEIRWS